MNAVLLTVIAVQDRIFGQTIGCPETSVRKYHYSMRNKPVERGFVCHDRLIQQTIVQPNPYHTVTHLEEVAIYTTPCHFNNTNKPQYKERPTGGTEWCSYSLLR